MNHLQDAHESNFIEIIDNNLHQHTTSIYNLSPYVSRNLRRRRIQRRERRIQRQLNRFRINMYALNRIRRLTLQPTNSNTFTIQIFNGSAFF